MAPRSAEELRSMGQMNPRLSEMLETHPLPKPPFVADFVALREHRAAMLREKHHLRYLPGPIKEVTELDHRIKVRDGSEITIRIYRPEESSVPNHGSPLVVMYHEGGWSMGDLTDEETNCRLFSRDLGAICVNVEYRLGPEHKFPTGINDCWDALKWAADNASSLGATPQVGFVIGGGSAGGNIAAVLAHLARDEKLNPPLTGQYLCVPAITCFMPPEEMPEQYRAEYLSHPSITPSIDPVLQADSHDPRGLVRVVGADVNQPLFVPFLYRNRPGGHRGLPPAYFQVCGLDPLRDEALIYERVLREEAGIETKLDLYPGLGHYFWTNFPLLDASTQFVQDTVKGVRWLLERSSKKS
ncbi:hypothetical protein KVR01_003574 [Diaporthe batatas]|uniref:uncharacterized protein n=1 Tax=Diaporthe batatas TaxID=748121 RepID=UPI001D0533E2|nr:uncharacterized protein KVR01_003574 [Diaporthe batatas]KAG8167885.1 hypothetical protein KVR01_003574 [Diaporthe batatas]